MARKIILLPLVLLAGFFACNKELTTGPPGFTAPDYFPEPLYHFASNPVTPGGLALGRRLFYDPVLSADNSISCAGCHIQTAAFSHRDHPVSHGISGRLGTRNAPPIMNLAWSSSFMWDGGIFDLDLQPIAPITNHVEMGDSLSTVLEKLEASENYPGLFEKAFGSAEITSARFLQALSQFMLICISDQSKYDSVRRNETVFSTQEQEGYALFQQKCNSCHREPLFTDYSFRNNGLPPALLNDIGRQAISLADTDAYKFKVPSLRNLSFTGPYMHDGRFLTIDAVLDHYDQGVVPGATTDPRLTQNSRAGIPLTAQEKRQLLTFLKTLDDKCFLENKILSEQ